MQNLTPVPGARPVFDDDGRERIDVATCGECGRSWNDAAVSSLTPAPSGRCPFEYDHTFATLATPARPVAEGIGSYRVDLAFSVEASSPAMAMRKILQAWSSTAGEAYMEAMHGLFEGEVSADDPRLVAGGLIGASNVSPGPVTTGAFDDVAIV